MERSQTFHSSLSTCRHQLNNKPHSVEDDHLSGTPVARRLVQPTRTRNGASRTYALLGLAPDGVYLAADVTANAGGLLHHPFTLATLARR